MRDYITGKDIDIQDLMNICKANDLEVLKFDMNNWNCGTSGCLIGNFLTMYPEDKLKIVYGNLKYDGKVVFNELLMLHMRFGLTIKEADFIFFPTNYYKRPYNIKRIHRKRAVKRLRKLIYYKLRKSELFANLDKARKASDTGIVKNASLVTKEQLNEASQV